MAGYSEKQADDIYIMGLLHDVGKIGIPDEVINKPGKLTEGEYETIKTHPVVGAKILEDITEMPKLAVGAKYHHERYGGGGYPESSPFGKTHIWTMKILYNLHYMRLPNVKIKVKQV